MNQNPKKQNPNKDALINNEIPFNKMFLIAENGDKLGVYTKESALEKAAENKKDLVLIATQPKPIARILDYGKFKYDRKKKEKELKEKQTNIQNHQIRLTPLIGDNDLQIKAKKAREFLLNGDRVKVSLKLRGRELGRTDIGYDTLKRFFELVQDIAKIDKDPSQSQARFLDMMIHPDKIKIAKYLREQESIKK